MEPIQYVNEHLWVHYCGHAFLILAFFSGIYTLVSGIVSVNKNEAENSEWLKAVKIGIRRFHCQFNTKFLAFGRTKKEAFCFGCFGTLCWDYFFGKA